MLKPFAPLLAMLLFSSCVTYQYFTVDSSQLPKDDRQSFVVDNDTMQLTYGFSGAGGDVTITVQHDFAPDPDGSPRYGR